MGQQQQQQRLRRLLFSSYANNENEADYNNTRKPSFSSSSSSSVEWSSELWDHGPLHDTYYEMIQQQQSSSPSSLQQQQQQYTMDPIQLQTLQSLERLRYQLLQHPPPPPPTEREEPKHMSSSSMPHKIQHSFHKLTNWLTGGDGGGDSIHQRQPSSSSLFAPSPLLISGVYIHGGVGCGKTFLMNDIFYESLNDTIWSQSRQKVHFHTFMLQIHQQMHLARQQQQQQHSLNEQQHNHHHYHQSSSHSHSNTHHLPHASGETILDAVIANIVQRGRLICFDEFQVTDVADALLLQRLFTALWTQYQCIVVATSNRSPDDLYLHGLQRDRFVPFIALLKQHCHSVSMWESEHDYRLLLSQQAPEDEHRGDNNNHHSSTATTTTTNRRVYYVGGKEVWKNYDRFFYELVGKNKAVSPTTLQTQGRQVHIPQASLSKGICRFTFESLCTKALGAADYLVLGQHFHTIFVDQIPILKLEHINWVRRFIIFVDTMYECNCKLVLHAKTEPNHIFQTGLREDEIASTEIDEIYAFQRTVSRLHEMSSVKYLQKQQKLHPIDDTNEKVDVNDSTSKARIESKASLLSRRKAFVNYTPS